MDSVDPTPALIANADGICNASTIPGLYLLLVSAILPVFPESLAFTRFTPAANTGFPVRVKTD